MQGLRHLLWFGGLITFHKSGYCKRVSVFKMTLLQHKIITRVKCFDYIVFTIVIFKIWGGGGAPLTCTIWYEKCRPIQLVHEGARTCTVQVQVQLLDTYSFPLIC